MRRGSARHARLARRNPTPGPPPQRGGEGSRHSPLLPSPPGGGAGGGVSDGGEREAAGGALLGLVHPGLLDDLEPAEVVGLVRRLLLDHETLADAAAAELRHAVVAEGVVAAPAERAVRRPRAAAAAGVGVVAGPAEAPELLHR